MQITVIGTGYVGLVAGACLADMGNDVICIDNNQEKLKQLENGIIPIYEPGLEELVKSNVLEKRLEFSSDIDSAVKKSQVCFIAVGTPQGEDGSAEKRHAWRKNRRLRATDFGFRLLGDPHGFAVYCRHPAPRHLHRRTNAGNDEPPRFPTGRPCGDLGQRRSGDDHSKTSL